METARTPPLAPRELRIAKRLDARGERAFFDAVTAFRGRVAGGRWRIDGVAAIGGEGVILALTDLSGAAPFRCVGKIAISAWHDPARLSSPDIRRARQALIDEARLLHRAKSPYLPQCLGVVPLANPHLERARGGAFAEDEPLLVLERLGGQDLDQWLCRVHRGGIPKDTLRPHLDRIAVGMLQGLVDMLNRGWLYADLRPGNVRVTGRPKRRVRFVDAGSCVPADVAAGRFPHVPSYLPPRAFAAMSSGEVVRCDAAVQAVMAGRTLYEVATGQAPKAGSSIDMMRLLRSAVSPPVAEVIAALAGGELAHCADALASLADRAKRRVGKERT